MKTVSIALLIIFSLSALSYSQDYVYEHAAPKDCPLVFTPSQYSTSYAYYSGEVLIKAKYQFIYEEDPILPDNPHLMIYPDESSLNILPYLTHRGEPERATAILIHGARNIAKQLFGKDYKKVFSKKNPFISGEAEFILSELAMGYECDSPSFVGKFDRIGKIIAPYKLKKIKEKDGC